MIQSSPVIVRLIEPKRDPTGLAHVFLDALGLTGVIVLAALVAAVIFGVVLFWIRSRSV
ncbi:MAG TPA: hypothetical protein VGJ29_09225 [Vicinamibacterales bacterium]